MNLPLYDDVRRLRTGVQKLKLWPKDSANPIGTCVENIQSADRQTSSKGFRCPEPLPAPVIYIELEEYHQTVLHNSHSPVLYDEGFGKKNAPASMAASMKAAYSDAFGTPGAWTQDDKKELNRLLSEDPLYELLPMEKQLIVNLRFQCKSKPRALAKFLQVWCSGNTSTSGLHVHTCARTYGIDCSCTHVRECKF